MVCGAAAQLALQDPAATQATATPATSLAAMPSVLFLADPGVDYVADALLHGLRSLLGADVLDVPRRASLYCDHPEKSAIYGRGFSIYGTLEALELDRSAPLERAAAGAFELVVIGAIWRDWHWWVRARELAGSRPRYAFVDGADTQWMYPYGPTWWKSPRRWKLPRAHTRGPYFKRETSALTSLLAARPVRPLPIAIAYPEEKLVAAPPEKTRDFTSHVVDPEVARRLPGASTSYVFSNEESYLADLRSSRFGVTTKRYGWDAMRHYEIAAQGCVPCFRRLNRKPAACAPHGLRAGVNCLAYDGAEDLFAQTAAVTDGHYSALQAGALAWARENTTRRRAEQFLDATGVAWR